MVQRTYQGDTSMNHLLLVKDTIDREQLRSRWIVLPNQVVVIHDQAIRREDRCRVMHQQMDQPKPPQLELVTPLPLPRTTDAPVTVQQSIVSPVVYTSSSPQNHACSG